MGLRRRILIVTILTMAVLFTMGFGFLSNLLGRSLENNVKENSVHMKDVRTVLSAHLNDIMLIQNSLRWDEDLLSYYSLHERGNYVSKANAQQDLHEKMGLLLSANMTFSNMMVVFPELDTVITDEGSLSFVVFKHNYSMEMTA